MGKKALIVDDDKINVRILELRLGQNGFQVFSAGNGEEGLKMFQTVRPDVILLDVEMPQMNGYTFILELSKLEGGKDVPVLVMTVHEQLEPIFKINSVKDYMVKPLDLDVLMGKIARYVK